MLIEYLPGTLLSLLIPNGISAIVKIPIVVCDTQEYSAEKWPHPYDQGAYRSSTNCHNTESVWYYN